ncbi:PQQ-dependent catabolism-associated CXXCW motif protein [Thiorhodococcus minor]|uniref:PQQ-dependent catabolism-associated CXXCW motif protein n=1 Tax=Thiorhodococcus minor TaxID=57489 RepID=A0A6M0K4T1_9GAMM|nr:PQQ-dependent catabolism-associated CXXCW motif protein [Thiorhodococcus minor]NEV64281.1 PQQ-dependent catabolism-associated CXXCW motif protein [Thiorhodococcus minor]
MRPRPWQFAFALICIQLALVEADPARAADRQTTALFDDQGYRLDDFLAPVPATAPGAITLTTPEARAMHQAGDAIFIDVRPAPARPSGLPAGTLWLPPARQSIPGAVWLPNIGFGRLSDQLDAYLRSALERLTTSDPSHPMVLYCRADCWMSWNAAKRIAALGYTAVYWYPNGTTGWSRAGLRLEPIQPEPLDSSRAR